MSHKYRLNLTLFGLLLLLVAAGLLAFLTAPESFDSAYEACEPGDADLTLHVNYQVRGTTGERDCAFPYRKRDRMTRLWEWYQDVRGLPCSRTYYVNGESGASMNSHGGDSENWSTWTEEVPEGVEVDISHTVTSGKQEVAASATVVIPFLLDTTGRQGKISYVARWQEN